MGIEPLLAPFLDYCDALGIKPTKGHELINSGEIESVLVGGRRMVFVDSIRSYAEKLRNKSYLGGKKPVKCALRKGGGRGPNDPSMTDAA
jgi:hypothetical protein